MGRFNAITLPPQYSNQGPLTCGPFTCQPPRHVAPLTGVRVDPRGPRHVSAPCAPPVPHVGSRGPAMWPCVPRCMRTGPACHVSLARPMRHVRTAVLRKYSPLFVIFLLQNTLNKVNRNQIKIQKRLKTSKNHNLRNTTPF